MSKYITQPELNEMMELSDRWESLNTDELKRLLYLCRLTQRHATNVTELWGVNDHGMIDGLSQVIEKIQGRLA